jgi:hypothetical protein
MEAVFKKQQLCTLKFRIIFATLILAGNLRYFSKILKSITFTVTSGTYYFLHENVV